MRPVGPVLVAGRTADAIVDAIRAANAVVDIVDRGAYLRVLVPAECRLRRADVELALGAPFVFPVDLERVMASFQGSFHFDDDEACWSAPAGAR
jgi:hypothetical protein